MQSKNNDYDILKFVKLLDLWFEEKFDMTREEYSEIKSVLVRINQIHRARGIWTNVEFEKVLGRNNKPREEFKEFLKTYIGMINKKQEDKS